MTTENIMSTCDVCGGQFRYGPHRYDLRRNQTYDIMVCDTCHQANWDGWAPHYEEKVTKRLKEKGLPLPARNQKDWLPRE